MFEIEAIILRETPFLESDMMITALSKDNLYSFIAKGVMKIDSKNRVSVTKFNKSRLELMKGKDGYKLKTGTLLKSYMKAKEDLVSLGILDFISEITSKLIGKEEAPILYPSLEGVLEGLDNGFDGLTLLLIYFATILKATGYGLNVDSCQICGKKEGMMGLSLVDGGFICKDHFNVSIHLNLNVNELKILRYIFKVEPKDYQKAVLPKEDSLQILNILEDFLYQVSDIKLKSLELVKKILK